jgi:hypothetical protein
MPYNHILDLPRGRAAAAAEVSVPRSQGIFFGGHDMNSLLCPETIF